MHFSVSCSLRYYMTVLEIISKRVLIHFKNKNLHKTRFSGFPTLCIWNTTIIHKSFTITSRNASVLKLVILALALTLERNCLQNESAARKKLSAKLPHSTPHILHLESILIVKDGSAQGSTDNTLVVIKCLATSLKCP